MRVGEVEDIDLTDCVCELERVNNDLLKRVKDLEI